jgi:hypothetical protein
MLSGVRDGLAQWVPRYQSYHASLKAPARNGKLTATAALRQKGPRGSSGGERTISIKSREKSTTP